MNIFLPYKSFQDCAKVLDDRRLTKQILECYQILKMIETKKSFPEYKNPYLHHPVVQHYFHQTNSIAEYAICMCFEFHYRFRKHHAYLDFFLERHNARILDDFIPLYAQYSKHDSRAIRETNFDKVCELFRSRLIEKWTNDTNRLLVVRWTKRELPEFINQNKENKNDRKN